MKKYNFLLENYFTIIKQILEEIIDERDFLVILFKIMDYIVSVFEDFEFSEEDE